LCIGKPFKPYIIDNSIFVALETWINNRSPKRNLGLTALEGDHPKELQDEEDDRDNDQGMNPTACFRKAGADIPPEKAEQPEDDED